MTDEEARRRVLSLGAVDYGEVEDAVRRYMRERMYDSVRVEFADVPADKLGIVLRAVRDLMYPSLASSTHTPVPLVTHEQTKTSTSISSDSPAGSPPSPSPGNKRRKR